MVVSILEKSSISLQINMKEGKGALQILNSMSDIISISGDITSKENMNSLIRVMQSTNRLVTQCLCINVLHNTTSQEYLSTFISEGGWEVLFEWISKAKPLLTNTKDDFSCYVMEILKVYECLPITVEDLKRNACAKIIKSLSKTSHQDIKILASRIVTSWMSKVKSQQESNEKSHKKHKKSKHHSKENDGSNLNNNNCSDSLTSIDSAKPKTTKSLQTKFRSTGLMDDIVPVVHRKKSDSLKRTANESSKHGDDKRVKSTDEADLPNQLQDSHKSIKPISIHEVYESSGFMDAIALQKRQSALGQSTNSTTAKKSRNKKMPIKIRSISPLVSPSHTSPSFYKDTMESTTEEQADSLQDNQSSSNVPRTSLTINPLGENLSEIESEPSFAVQNAMLCQDSAKPISMETSSCDPDPKLPVGEGDVKKKKRKSVSWADESNLKSFFYFELDETERVNVNRISFDEIRKQELRMEKDHMQEKPDQSSYKLVLLDLKPTAMVYGAKSLEKDIQSEREEQVLKVLYFSKNMIPDTPSEPDNIALRVETNTPRLIPIDNEEETSSEPNDKTNDKTSNVKVIKDAVDNFSLTPQMANLLNSLNNSIPKPGNQTNDTQQNVPLNQNNGISLHNNVLSMNMEPHIVPIHLPPPPLNMNNTRIPLNAQGMPHITQAMLPGHVIPHRGQDIPHGCQGMLHRGQDMTNWERGRLQFMPPHPNNMNMRNSRPTFRGPLLNGRGHSNNMPTRYGSTACRNFLTPNGCRFGNHCKFFHPPQ